MLVLFGSGLLLCGGTSLPGRASPKIERQFPRSITPAYTELSRESGGAEAEGRVEGDRAPVNRREWVTTEVRLYNFDDVLRLIDLLNGSVRRVRPGESEGGVEDGLRIPAGNSDPFWVARPALPDGQGRKPDDPALRVWLFGFPDRRTIFVRGLPEDVADVTATIRELDRPQPQAEITLWTWEFGWTAGERGSQRAEKALRILDEELQRVRNEVTLCTVILRRVIDEEVMRSTSQYRSSHPDAGELPPDELARLAFYSPELLASLGWDSAYLEAPPPAGAGDRFQPAETSRVFLRALLPDPRAARTLGECQLVLFLADGATRERVVLAFPDRVSQQREKLEAQAREGRPTDRPVPAPGAAFQEWISIIRPGQPLVPAVLSPFQLELIAALRTHRYRAALRDMLRTIRARVRLAGIPDQPVRCFPLDCGAAELGISQSELWTTLRNGSDAEFEALLRRLRRAIADGAREAAADVQFSRCLRALEEDLDRDFWEPMFERLEDRMRATGVEVGTLQRKTILTTGRLASRTLPQRSQPSELGEAVDVLPSAEKLAQLVQAAGVGRGRTALNEKVGSEPPVWEPDDPPAKSYVGVDPVFDPTGRSVRFRLDLGTDVTVREADGSVDPRHPRIEHHSVKTEVDLHDGEIREVSRFVSTAQLGRRSVRRGGIPVLKKLPVVREIPLLGWFSRRSGRPPRGREYVTLGQSAFFPALRDLFDP